MVNDNIKLKFNMTISPDHVNEVIEALKHTNLIKRFCDPSCIKTLNMVKVYQYIPTEYTTSDKLYYIVKKRGYTKKRIMFIKELSYMQGFGLVDCMETFNGTIMYKRCDSDCVIIDIWNK